MNNNSYNTLLILEKLEMASHLGSVPVRLRSYSAADRIARILEREHLKLCMDATIVKQQSFNRASWLCLQRSTLSTNSLVILLKTVECQLKEGGNGIKSR